MNVSQHSNHACLEPSIDGYIRMTFEAFAELDFIQRWSWEDSGLSEDLILDGIEVLSAGYNEWATGGSCRVSVGWAWFDSPDGRRCIAPGGVSSNVMLVTPRCYDLGSTKTGELLRAWVSTADWTAPHEKLRN